MSTRVSMLHLATSELECVAHAREDLVTPEAREHVQACTDCAARVQGLKQFSAFLRMGLEPTLDRTLSPVLESMVQRALASGTWQQPTGSGATRSSWRVRGRRWLSQFESLRWRRLQHADLRAWRARVFAGAIVLLAPWVGILLGTITADPVLLRVGLPLLRALWGLQNMVFRVFSLPGLPTGSLAALGAWCCWRVLWLDQRGDTEALCVEVST